LRSTYEEIRSVYVNFYNFKWKADFWLEELLPPPGHYKPTVPLKPNMPVYYPSKYNFGLNLDLSAEGQAWYQNWGGWGYLTMGLLKPIVNNNHSYGLMGQDGVNLNKGFHYD
jgi:hypothetical protein